MLTQKTSLTPLYTGRLRNTPLGDLWLAVTPSGLAAVGWEQDESNFHAFLTRRFKRPVEAQAARVAHAADELKRYLRGELRSFSLPIDWGILRPFQQAVLKATWDIPYGETRTYGYLAALIGRPKAARAVGRAEATNPMPLVIPCHRVIGADGRLRGYGGGEGLPTKEWLLKLEGTLMT